MSRVLLAGLGDLGSAIARRLTAAGHKVAALRRSARAGPEDVQVFPVNLHHSSPPAQVRDARQLIICLSPSDRSREGYQATYLDATENLLRDQQFERIVLVSSSSVWGYDDGRLVDAATAPAPASWRGEILLQAEARVRAACPQAVLLRLAGLYGPGRTYLLDQISAGKPVLRSEAWTNRIHRDDAADLVCHLLSPDLPCGVHIGVDSRPARRREVVAWLAAQMGLPVPSFDRGAAQGKRLDYSAVAATGFRLRYADYAAGYLTLPELKKRTD